MTTTELHIRLKEAYSNQNLNKISVTLIGLYRNEQFGTLCKIVEMISDSVDIMLDPEGRYFARLMMLYHPDRGDFHRNEMEKLAASDDLDGLLRYAHILKLGRIEEIAETLASYEDIDYAPVYEWDVNLEGFTILDTRESQPSAVKYHQKTRSRNMTFYNAVKLRMYGRTNVAFPSHYLEDLEELELSQSGISDLDGIQLCIHTLDLDLSGNRISDVSLLWGLKQLVTLNLSDNRIEDIDMLANLRNLKTLYLTNNAIRDINALFNLGKLEYVELTGTRVNAAQIRELAETGVTVVMDGV